MQSIPNERLEDLFRDVLRKEVRRAVREAMYAMNAVQKPQKPAQSSRNETSAFFVVEALVEDVGRISNEVHAFQETIEGKVAGLETRLKSAASKLEFMATKLHETIELLQETGLIQEGGDGEKVVIAVKDLLTDMAGAVKDLQDRVGVVQDAQKEMMDFRQSVMEELSQLRQTVEELASRLEGPATPTPEMPSGEFGEEGGVDVEEEPEISGEGPEEAPEFEEKGSEEVGPEVEIPKEGGEEELPEPGEGVE